jgi:nicotinamidase-related amidase
MKEVYFTEETLFNNSARMLEEINFDKKFKQFESDLTNSALLVLDMQEYFLSPASHAFVPSSPAIIEGINELITAFRKMNKPVILSRHINTQENAGQMICRWKELLTTDNPLSCISDKIFYDGLRVIEKSQYDAFYNTGLEGILKYANCSSVVICGLMTHLCCESTARSAFVRGFEVIMPLDGTATYNRRFHFSSMYNLSHGFVSVTTVKELIEQFEKYN